MSNPTEKPDLAKAMADLSAIVGRLAPAAPVKATPGVVDAQSNEAAINAEINVVRERVERGVTREQHEAEVRALHAKIAESDRVNAALMATNVPVRAGQLNMEDATRFLAETAQVPGSNAKMVYKNIGARRAANAEGYNTLFQGRAPLDVLMRGAFVEKNVGVNLGGRTHVWKNYAPLITAVEDEVLREAHKMNDAMYIWTLLQRSLERAPLIEQCPFYPDYRAAFVALGKALDNTDTSSWVPTGFSAALIERYDLERNLTKYLTTFKMPRNTFDLPTLGNRITVSLVAENTADPESATATPTSDLNPSKINLSLVQLAVRMAYSLNLEEDSIIPLVDEIVNEMASAWGYSEEEAIISGDTTATHQDADTTTSTDSRKAWKGLRKFALQQNYKTDMNSTHTADGYRAALGAMGRFASARPDELFLLVGPVERTFLLTLKDANNYPVVYANAVSPPANAAIMTLNNVPSLFGAPVVCSEGFREDLNVNGIYDSTGGYRASMWVNRKGFIYAWTNEAPDFFPFFNTRTLQREITMRVRRIFRDRLAIASNHTIHYMIKLA